MCRIEWKLPLGSPLRICCVYQSKLCNLVVSNTFCLCCKRIYRMSKHRGFAGGTGGKEHACQCRRQEMWVWSLSGKTPWRRAWPPTPAFLPGESHGQRSLSGYSPQSCKESDTTERLSTHLCQNKGFRELMRLNNQIWKWPGEWVDGVPAKERSVQDFTPGFAATGHWQYQIPLLSWVIFPSLPCIFATPSQESKLVGSND